MASLPEALPRPRAPVIPARVRQQGQLSGLPAARASQ
jgi:hypothetical protein